MRRPVPARPAHAETLGKETWGGAFPGGGVSAHPKVDERTGELLFFNYGTEAPYLHYGVVDPADELVHYVDIPLPGPRLPHDMAFTENYAILNDCPLFWEPAVLAKGAHVARFHPELPTRLGVIPRRGAPERSAGSRPRRPTSCTGSTPTRTATRSCSTASSRATRSRPTTAWAPSGSARSASSRSTACRPGCTAGG